MTWQWYKHHIPVIREINLIVCKSSSFEMSRNKDLDKSLTRHQAQFSNNERLPSTGYLRVTERRDARSKSYVKQKFPGPKKVKSWSVHTEPQNANWWSQWRMQVLVSRLPVKQSQPGPWNLWDVGIPNKLGQVIPGSVVPGAHSALTSPQMCYTKNHI